MVRLSAAALVAVVLYALGAAAAQAAPQPSAQGNGGVQALEQTFNFGARGVDFGADGRIHVVFPNTDPDTQIKGRVNCLKVTPTLIGNRAFLSGNITSITPEENPATAPTYFFAFAEDNGEPGAFRDRWNFKIFGPSSVTPPTTCQGVEFGEIFLTREVTSGNIDVDPVP